MPDKNPPIIPFGSSGKVYIPSTVVEAPTIDGGGYKTGNTEYSDPFFSGGDFDPKSRQNIAEAGQDYRQPWTDKLGNGMFKMAGSFADGILSTVGTIYGIPAAIIEGDGTKVWDNPFTNIGSEISESVNETFRNYRSLGEQNASAWSPDYWATMNFFSDNVLGNLGYAAAAYVSGFGIGKVLSKVAPFIAGRNLTTGLDIINSGGFEALSDVTKAYNAVKRWDSFQQAVSIGISAAGEGSVEALGAYKDAKRNMLARESVKYGGESNIPDAVLAEIERDAKSVGNITYGLNLPILAGANMIQWGKALSGFNSEFKNMAKNSARLTSLGEFGTYQLAQDQVKSGVSRAIVRGLSATGKALKSNLSEAAQEGAQYIAAEGTKNWYQRTHDPVGWEGVKEYTNPYVDALVSLVSTQEGVANLLGGFAGGSAFGMSDYIRAIAGDPKAKAAMDQQVDVLNNPFVQTGGGSIKQNLSIYLKNMARHASAEADLQDALSRGDEKDARTAKFDQLKTYINSRIETGRMDILEDEVNQLSKMSNDEFKTFFGLDANDNVDKDQILDKFKNSAKDMHETYKMMDRIFNPDMYRLNKLSVEDRDAKLKDLHEYKTMLWSYMMDYKDRDQRAGQLDKEVGAAFGGLINTGDLFKDQFTTDELNDIYRQYVAVNVEHELNKAASPLYKDSDKEAQINALKSKLKGRIEELTEGKLANMVTMQDFQGTGRKDFIEDYIFNVNKRILPVLNNPVAQTALNLADINQVITKTHDLVDLHADRRMAINAYNQLASVIKTGDFTGQYVNNPAYNDEQNKGVEPFITQTDENGETQQVPNPDYVPAKIRSEEMLNYDGYAQRKNERKDFYKDQQLKKDKNQDEQDNFNTLLDNSIDENLTDLSKQFHDKIKEYIHGSENTGTKPLKVLTNDQLAIKQALAQRNLQAMEMRGEFAVNSKKERDSFDLAKYINAHAEVAAVNSEIAARGKKRADDINKKAQALVEYVYANKIDPSLLVEGFKLNNIVVDKEIVKRAAAIIAEQKAEAAKVEALKQQKEAAQRNSTMPQTVTNEEEPIVDDEIFMQFIKDGKLNSENLSYVVADIAKKLAKGEILTLREDAVYQVHKDFIDKKVKAKYGVNPIHNVKKVQSGTYAEQEPSIEPGENTNDNIKSGIVATSKASESIAPKRISGSFIRLRRSDLAVGESGRENVYDSNGNAITNQLTFSLFEPGSPVNLHNNPQIRFRFVGFSTHGTKEEPSLLMEVRATDNDTWQPTKYFMQGMYDMKGELISPELSKDEVQNKELVASYHALITEMQNDAKANGSVEVEIKGGISFGALVENQRDADGNRTRRGLIESFGEDINNTDSLTSVKMGVILNDSKNDSVIVFKDQKGPAGELTDVNEMPGVYVHKALINAVANADGKGTGDRGGQYVALLPTGQMTPDGSKQFHFPVLLSGKALADFQTSAYNIGSGRNKGTKANIGEVMMDALLNPYKAEYNDLFPHLFEMAGLQKTDYKGPELTDWKIFYQDARIHSLINRVFFSSGKTLDNATEYKLPFKFEIVDTSERGGAIMARIGISDPLLKDRRTVDIFLSTKDGSLVTPQNEAERADFTQARIDQTYEFRKRQGKTDNMPVTYADIQDIIKDKVFHVEIARMSQSTPTPFTGLVLDEKGKVTGKSFPSYFHYVDELGLAQTTVQGIKNDENNKRQYFVNQRVYLAPKPKVKDEITDLFGAKSTFPQPKGAEVSIKGTEPHTKAILDNRKKAAIEERREEELNRTLKSEQDYINLAKQYNVTYTKVPNAMLGTKEGNATHTELITEVEKLINAKYDAELSALNEPLDIVLGAGPEVAKTAKAVVTGTAPKAGKVVIVNKPSAEAAKNSEREANTKGMSSVKAASNIMNRRGKGKTKPMLNLETYKSITQRSMSSTDSAFMHKQELITDEITTILLNKLIDFKNKKAGAYQVENLKATLKNELAQKLFSLMQEVRPSLSNMSFNEWQALEEDHPDFDWLGSVEQEELSAVKQNQYDSLFHAYQLFDIDEFEALHKSGEMTEDEFDLLYTGGTKEDPQFFIGYANKALARLAELNIVKAVNTGNTEIELDEETGNYTQRFNDSWALMINPKETLGLQAKVILNTVPEVQITKAEDGALQVSRQVSETGFLRNMKYDNVFVQLVNIGLEVQPEQFETELMNNPAYDLSPAIRAVRMKMDDVKAEKGLDTYKQVIQQIATAVTGLRINSVTQAILTKNEGFNVKTKIFSAARTNLNSQVVDKWESQTASALSNNDYISYREEYNEKAGVFVVKPVLNKFEYEVKVPGGSEVKTGDFADIFSQTIKDINANYTLGKNTGKLSFEGYLSIARTIKDMLGIELVEGDYNSMKQAGYTTALMLRNIGDAFNSLDKKEDRVFRNQLKRANIKSFSEFMDRTFITNIAGKIKQAVNDGTYDDNEPFRNSGTAVDLLSKMFQSSHQSLVNPQAKDVNNKNQYVYVIADMLNHEMRRLRSETNAKQLLSLPLMEFDYHLSEQFKRNADGSIEYAPRAYWKNMTIETINGMKLTSDAKRRRKGKNKGDIIEARKVPAGDVDLMSMVFYQNEENTKGPADQLDRGQAKYFMPFGDSSAASYLNFNKYAFGFDYNNGQFMLRDGKVKDILYGHFKSEVSRALAGFATFNDVNDNPDLTIAQKKAKLDKGYHYFERGDTIIPGASTRMYYFGRKTYEITEEHPLYETMTVDGDVRPIGIKEELLDETGALNDEALSTVFGSIIDTFLSDIVNSKIKQIAPIKSSFFELEEPEQLENGKYASPKFISNIMDTRYIDSIKRLFLQDSIIDGKPVHTYFNPKLHEYESIDDANENGYHAQVLKTAIIDQQVNALIANTLMRKMTWDFAAFDTDGNWDKFSQVLGKRESAFNSPFTVTASNSTVNAIIYNDVSYSAKKVNLADLNVTAAEQALFDFMKNNGLASYVTDKVPARYKELTAIHYAATMDGKSAKQTAKILKAALNSKLTDGGSIITLREYLFQMQQQGVISYSDFGRLYNKYSNPDLVLTESDKKDLLFKGQKMVGIGSVMIADRKAPMYIKDAKIVLIPSQVKGTRMETIMNLVKEREPNSLIPSPGIQLVPASGAKLHNGKVVDLYNEDDEINADAIKNATIFSFPRSMYGEQVQNPNKESSGITKGIQLQKYILDNIHDDKIFGEEMFSSPKAEGDTVIFNKAVKSYGKTDGTAAPEKGITKVEARDAMVNIMRHMYDYKLQDLVDKFGLDYSLSDEWKQAAKDEGFTDYEQFQDHIDRLEQSKSYEERQIARDLTYRKFGLVARTISKMINDIKQQAYTKKGIEISQLRVLNEILVSGDGKDKTEQLRMPLTFTPGNKQYQQVILAEIQNLFAHTKLNGFSGIQISAAGHEKSGGVKGSTTLKGYGLKYDSDGKVIGFSHAEIGIPWLFKDTAGKPLDYYKYVNEDGSPKIEMFNDEMLHIIGYRIPNTGLNMAGRFKIAKFFKPGYTDSIMIPDILFSQMGTDLDFDKLYNYLYNYRITETGKIDKVKGVINMRQNNASSVINSVESKRWALHNSMLSDDPGYRMRYKLFRQAIQKMNARLEELEPVKPEEAEQTGTGIFAGINKAELDLIKERLDNEIQSTEGKSDAIAQLEKQYVGLINDFNYLQGKIDQKKSNFNHQGWLGLRKDNYLKAQSYQQLENAYFDIYHMVMSDMEMLPAMLTPLTSDLATEQVDEPKYNGRSISEMEASSVVEAPNSEAYQVKVRGDNKSSNENIGALANGQSVIDAFQTANLSVGSKLEGQYMKPVVFRDNDGNIIEENEADPRRFVTPNINTAESIGSEFEKMQLRLPSSDRIYAIPNRLARIYAVDGKTKVTEIVQSLLQAFLDFNNNRNVAHTNINLATLNPMMAMVGLGYTDHIFDFFGQEILKDYTKGFYAEKSPFIKSDDFLYDIVNNTVEKAGLSQETFANYVSANDNNVEQALYQMLIEQKLGDTKTDHEKFFSPQELHDMITTQYSDKKTSAYYVNQLFVLDMFLRLKPIGEQTFYLMQSINLESKGFSNVSILGALDQISNHNNVSKRTNPINGEVSYDGIIGSERLGPWNKDENPHGMQTVHTAALAYAKKGMDILTKNNTMFSDLSPMFKASRNTLASMTGKRNLGNLERFNINTIQYILSNPELYTEFLDIIPQEDRGTAHDIRKHIFVDKLEFSYTSKNNLGSIETKVLESSLARAISDIRDKIDPESGIAYSEIYPVLGYLNTMVKGNMESPSWVNTNNTAQFKERVGQEMPFYIQTMLHSSNPELQKIAKGLFLYYYLGNGVTTPKSFGHLLPQENLFTDGGFADKLNEALNNLNQEAEALKREVNSARTMMDYDKPYWFRQFDPNVVKINRGASERQLELYTQYLQNNPFEAEMQGYTAGVEFTETNDPNIVRITDKGKVAFGDTKYNPKSFMEISGDRESEDGVQYTLYVINPDYNTYTRVNRAGTTNYTEYNYGNRFTPTLIQKNRLKDPAVSNKPGDIVSNDFVLGTNQKILIDSNNLMPVQIDKVNDLNAVFQLTFLNENSRKLEEFVDNPIEERQLTALATALFPMIPAGTRLVPYSISKAKKDFQTRNGLVSVNGKEAFGFFRAEKPHGMVQMAYEFIDQDKTDPLLLKKVLLHESAHAAVYNVFKVLDRLESKAITKSEAAKLMQLDRDSEEGPVADVQGMQKAYKKYKELYEFLKNNLALKKAYLEQNNATIAKDKTVAEHRLGVIMSDIDEFTARMFNDKALRDALNQVPYNKKTMFDRIVDFLKEVLGLTPGTAAYSAMGNLFEILEPIKGSKIATEGWRAEDIDKIFSANTAVEKKALFNLQEQYAGVSNIDVQRASPEELKLYDRLVKEGKIIC